MIMESITKLKIIESVYIYKQESTGAKRKELLIHIYIYYKYVNSMQVEKA
jgi:hypothetical protein